MPDVPDGAGESGGRVTEPSYREIAVVAGVSIVVTVVLALLMAYGGFWIN